MRVDLLAATPDLIKVLWTAARTCYSKNTPQTLWTVYPGEKKAASLLRTLWRRGHHSVFEHASLTFAISGISRVCLTQLTRHRIGISFSVQSHRYTIPRDLCCPSTIEGDTGRAAVFWGAVESCQNAYKKLCSMGVPLEDARFVLPQAVSTNLVLTVNLRELMHLYRLRVAEPGAQWEIHDLVELLVQTAIRHEPVLARILDLEGSQ